MYAPIAIPIIHQKGERETTHGLQIKALFD